MPVEVAASPVTPENAGAGFRFQQAFEVAWIGCNHVAVMTLCPTFPKRIQSKDDRDMAPRPSVTKHPFTLVFVVIALMAPFAGLAWRTREWMGW